ncbi:DoxX family protein [Corynebacterium frankenforstense]
MSEKNDRAGSQPLDDDFDDLDLPTYDPDKDAKTSRPARGSGAGSSRLSRRDADKADKADKDRKAAKEDARNDEAAHPRRRPRRTDPYTRTGRAAPQSIPPRAAEPEKRPAAGAEAADSAETEFLDRPAAGAARSARPDRSEPLASDAPTSTRDEGRGLRSLRRRRGEEEAPETTVMPAGDTTETLDIGPTAAGAGAGAGAAGAASVADERALDDEEVIAPGDLGGLEEEPLDATRRGTTDFGLFLLRLFVSAFLILHSVTVFFRLDGGEGLAGLEADYVNYAWSGILSVAVPAAELAAGVFLLLGLITPLFAAVGIVAVGFSALHEIYNAGAGLDLFNWPADVWLPLVLGGALIALQFTGPGTWAVDYPRGWARRPLASSWIFIVVAVVAFGALWWFGAGVNPF